MAGGERGVGGPVERGHAMSALDVAVLNHRGDAGFESLSELEKDIYVLMLFHTLYEMEGVTHFYSYHGGHAPRLVAFLEAVNAPNRRAVKELSRCFKDGAEDFDDVEVGYWADLYYSQSQEMWRCVTEFLRREHDIELA
jgi:hypothetical protein